MNPPLRSTLRVTLSLALFVMAASFFPDSARAIQLRWSTGGTDLTMSQNTQAILVVQADSTEGTLPNTWRLQWTADSLGVQFSAFDPNSACLADTAKVDSVAPPSTPADSAANQTTARFCSSGSNNAATAYFLSDLPGGGHGKLKVVALDPSDSTQVIESNEATFNGGVDGEFAPVILTASRTHVASDLVVQAVGAGFADVPVVQIAAPDTSWHLALNVTNRTATSLTATARVAADLPAFVLRVGGASSGDMAVAPLAADTASMFSVQSACFDTMREVNLITHETIQPKDFAFVASRDSFHVFYIRHDMNLSTDETEKIIGHKRSRNLSDWFPTENTMTAISARIGTNLWDNYHVWAPTIIHKTNGDPTYYMLYTGVQLLNGQQIQRIGVATSADLNIWKQDSTWVYSPDHAPSWAELDSTTYSGQQFRDPFVMAATDTPNTYILLVAGGSHSRRPRMVVGVARSDGDLRVWKDRGALWNTDAVHSRAAFIESPHAFVDPGGRWSLYFSSYNSPSDGDFVSFETNNNTPSSPIDPDTTKWSAPDTLYKALGGDPLIYYWHASEYLKWAPGYEYLCAFDDSLLAVDISQVSWSSSHTYTLDCPAQAPLSVDPQGSRRELALNVLGARPSHAPVAFAVEAPTKGRVRFAIYDVLGRRVRTVLDEEVLPGRRELRWDGRSTTGDAVGPGVYFARLTSVAGQRVARIVLIR